MTQNLADIVEILRGYPPLPMRVMSARLAKEMGLTPDTLSRNYLSVLENSGDLYCDRRGLWCLLEEAEVAPHKIADHSEEEPREKKPLSKEIHLGKNKKTIPVNEDEGIPDEPYEPNKTEYSEEERILREQRDRIRAGAQQK